MGRLHDYLRTFMTTHATNHPIRMVYYVPVLSPLHVLATVALALPYRSLILSLQRRLPLQNRPWPKAGLALTNPPPPKSA